MIQMIKSIITNVLAALYQSFWFSFLLSVFVMFFYLYSYQPINAGKGWKTAVRTWVQEFKSSLEFRKRFFLVFYTVMILFRTLLNRDLWLNPLSNIMGAWWIWEEGTEGTISLTTECLENIALMFPFTLLLLWTAENKILKTRRFRVIIWQSLKISFLFSVVIESLQLILQLGTFQLSDLFYNTLGGGIGGIVYWCGYKIIHRNKKE